MRNIVLLISILIFSISLFAKQDLIDSQPEILFKYDQLKKNQESLQVARDDLQKIRLENTELKHQVENLELRAEELYAQVNTMV